MMQVIMPMAGSGRRFQDAGYTQPKPLIPIGGTPMVERLMRRFPRDWRFVFLCNEEHLKLPALRETLNRAAPGAVVAGVTPHKRGPVYTIDRSRELINPDPPTLINYCDFDFQWDVNDFLAFIRGSGCDGAILCYRGFHPHHRGKNFYAYCREEGGRVTQVREKKNFTADRRAEFASSGTYYFKSGALAVKYCARALRGKPAVDGEHYVSEVYNNLIADGLDVRVYEIERFAQWGTPEDLNDCLYWHELFKRWGAKPAAEDGRAAPRLLMPMAGLGRRFAAEGGAPKPLRPVLGKPMFKSAMEHLPSRSSDAVFVLQRPLVDAVRREAPQATLVALDAPTAGGAASALRARGALDPEAPVLVSACDHGLLLDESGWRKLLGAKPDAAVCGQRGYPDTRRYPKSYSYIELGGGADKVRRVSLKKPLSASPEKDLLLVGTFYFRKARFLFETAEAALERGASDDGEVHLDAVVNTAVAAGLDVRCFETAGYLGWGTPDCLDEFNYWRRFHRERGA